MHKFGSTRERRDAQRLLGVTYERLGRAMAHLAEVGDADIGALCAQARDQVLSAHSMLEARTLEKRSRRGRAAKPQRL